MRGFYTIIHIFLCLSNIPNGYTYAVKLPVMEDKNLTLLPTFDADSAYYFIQRQVNFGPRVPNTPAHQLCKKYLKKQLKQYRGKIFEQKFEVIAFNGDTLRLSNIIASWNLKCPHRILLAAHWDTRPFADKDLTGNLGPILGANDGASGVGVLLEIAHSLYQIPLTELGIDIILFDGEDYGPPATCKKNHKPDVFWCLGSQYWSQHKHKKDYIAQCGILLDMVGSREATFYREKWSTQYAKNTLDKIWGIAEELGYADLFIDKPSKYAITDDHYFVNKYANIPMVNIIDHSLAPAPCFASYHHTHADNLDIIDKKTLKAVGDTILRFIYTTYQC